jgi:hypothetical protein
MGKNNKIITMNVDINEQLKFEKLQTSLSEKVAKQLEKGDKMSKVLHGLEIKPTGFNILVLPYAKNPYEKVEVRESGIVLDDGAATFKNPDSGQEEEQQQAIIVGRVIEAGPECKWVKEGDDIYYHFNSVIPIPFFRQGFQCVAEPRTLMILNTDLTERYGTN